MQLKLLTRAPGLELLRSGIGRRTKLIVSLAATAAEASCIFSSRRTNSISSPVARLWITVPIGKRIIASPPSAPSRNCPRPRPPSCAETSLLWRNWLSAPISDTVSAYTDPPRPPLPPVGPSASLFLSNATAPRPPLPAFIFIVMSSISIQVD